VPEEPQNFQIKEANYLIQNHDPINSKRQNLWVSIRGSRRDRLFPTVSPQVCSQYRRFPQLRAKLIGQDGDAGN
jgi:hypothetical protein